jgi:septal ring-binding cell division protein DamX
MIEIDDTKHHDFLSDEARSGFGDDNESFGLGRFGGEKPTEEKKPTEMEKPAANVAVSPSEAISQNASEGELIHQPVQAREHPAILSEDISSVTDAEPLERLPLEKQTTEISQPFAETTGENIGSNNPPLEETRHQSTENLVNQFSEAPAPELPTAIADEAVSIPAASSLDLDNSSFAEENDSVKDTGFAADAPMDNTIETTPIPSAHEAYIPPVFGTGETIFSENASADGTRKVITIPSAEEQRKEDAAKAAAQAPLKTTPPKNAWSRSAIAASVAGIILATFVASGYMLMRKTTLGSGARNLWATLTGDQSKAVPQDSAAVALLDLTKKSQNNSTQQLTNNNAPSQTSAPSANLVQSTVQSSQATVISQNKQPVPAQVTATGQSVPQSQSNTAISGAATKNSGSANGGQNTSTLAANTQADKKQQPAQEKSSQAPPTTKQPTKPASAPEAKPAATQAPASTNPTTKQATTASAAKTVPATKPTTTSAKPTRSLQSAALERQKTQQISGVFAIQVYASPSIADAEDWVERLKRRGMVNAMVTSQVIRGQTMYRVRFGLYNTLRDAERDAERFGYVGSWVVRLR